jgi:Fe-S cluster assembly scaffold protein SufB
VTEAFWPQPVRNSTAKRARRREGERMGWVDINKYSKYLFKARV